MLNKVVTFYHEKVETIGDVSPNHSPVGQAIETELDIIQFIERPLQDVMRMLLAKNIPTHVTSANKNDLKSPLNDGKFYSRVGIDFDGLTDANRQILSEIATREIYDIVSKDKIGMWSEGILLDHGIPRRSYINNDTGVRVIHRSEIPSGIHSVTIYIPINDNMLVVDYENMVKSIFLNFLHQDKAETEQLLEEALLARQRMLRNAISRMENSAEHGPIQVGFRKLLSKLGWLHR